VSIGDRVEGTPVYWFEVEIDEPAGNKSTWIVVRSVSGVSQSFDPYELWEGGSSDQQQVLPGKKRWPNLVLQGAVVDEKAFFDWFSKVQIGKLKDARAHGTIRLKKGGGDSGKVIATWDFVGAFPIKYAGPSFDTHATTIAFETIELTHLGLKRVD
jgi:phage tail-like protein